MLFKFEDKCLKRFRTTVFRIRTSGFKFCVNFFLVLGQVFLSLRTSVFKFWDKCFLKL